MAGNNRSRNFRKREKSREKRRNEREKAEKEWQEKVERERERQVERNNAIEELIEIEKKRNERREKREKIELEAAKKKFYALEREKSLREWEWRRMKERADAIFEETGIEVGTFDADEEMAFCHVGARVGRSRDVVAAGAEEEERDWNPHQMML